MIDPAIINYFIQKGDINYYPYASPIGEIYILGDNDTVKVLIFKNSYPGTTAINRHFSKAMTGSIHSTKIALDDYFSNSCRKANSTSLKPVVTTPDNDQILKVVINTASLILDLSPFTLKQISVYQELLKVDAGTTVSYGELAARSGIPRGARFIGNAMALNHFPIIIPCHRVIKTDGSMGNYSGGTDIKKYLLNFENQSAR